MVPEVTPPLVFAFLQSNDPDALVGRRRDLEQNVLARALGHDEPLRPWWVSATHYGLATSLDQTALPEWAVIFQQRLDAAHDVGVQQRTALTLLRQVLAEQSRD